MKNIIQKYPAFAFILITMPLMLYGKLLILPTFDDWCTLSSPNYDPDFIKYIMPYGYIWRPFDAIMGYIVAIDHKLFPKLNHVVIFIGHISNVLLVYNICKILRIGKLAKNIATIYFYLSPCMLATVFSCDSLNQTYSQFWGLAAILAYLSLKGKTKYITWTLFIFIAALAKDNGIAFAVIPPIIAFAFKKIDKNTLVKHFAFGLGIAVVYACIRLSLPSTYIENTDYSTFVLSRKIKEIFMVTGFSWFAIDYISLLHAPSRNLLIAGITFLLSFPFIYCLFFKNFKDIWKDKTFLLLISCILIALSPNLLITLSVMNTYAGLGMVSLLTGYIVDKFNDDSKIFKITFVLYIITAVYVDYHHWYMSYKTSLTGKEMALKAIKGTGQPTKKAYVLIIEDDYPRFSSFCVIPSDAFGWGLSAKYENAYKWPEILRDTTIARKDSASVSILTKKALKNGFDCVWIVNKKDVKVIKKQ